MKTIEYFVAYAPSNNEWCGLFKLMPLFFYPLVSLIYLVAYVTVLIVFHKFIVTSMPYHGFGLTASWLSVCFLDCSAIGALHTRGSFYHLILKRATETALEDRYSSLYYHISCNILLNITLIICEKACSSIDNFTTIGREQKHLTEIVSIN